GDTVTINGEIQKIHKKAVYRNGTDFYILENGDVIRYNNFKGEMTYITKAEADAREEARARDLEARYKANVK
ncbi:hypothetical protein KC872_04415, partial [Candidatus Kaiserbacteria bacterium]|nr:hypothetical protein [Candidatus Kaiserbacteria bacterium]